MSPGAVGVPLLVCAPSGASLCSLLVLPFVDVSLAEPRLVRVLAAFFARFL